MRPLPRLHAVTDHAVLALEDLGVRAAALAAAGSAVALHARDREATGAHLTAVTQRFLALAGPPEAAVFVNGRPDIAASLGAHGVQLGATDLAPADARKAAGQSWSGWIGSSVHSGAEARAALDAGADFLMVGPIYETATHPGRRPTGLALVTELARLGPPVVAIGGVTPERSSELREAGAYGVAAISAAWHVRDPAAAALALLAPWLEAA
jgi:thiamine-phosphate pyrophosphorylase